jgi:uncharacterized protein
MSRLLGWLLLALAAWWLIKRLRGDAGTGADDGSGASPGRRATGKTAAPQAMLRCAHCGVHLPQADALLDDAQRSYCSATHRGAGPR